MSKIVFLSVSAFGGAGSFGSTVRSAMALFASKLGDSSGKISDPDLFTINKAAEKSLRIFLGTVGDSSGGGGGGGGGNNANESSDGGDDEQKAVKPKKDWRTIIYGTFIENYLLFLFTHVPHVPYKN